MSIEDGWVTERLTVEGRTVDVRRSTDGDGVPIVHIHGFAISGKYLMPTARLLARRWVTWSRTCPATDTVSAATVS